MAFPFGKLGSVGDVAVLFVSLGFGRGQPNAFLQVC